MKTVYWRIQAQAAGWYTIEFWMRKDRSDLETVKMLTTDENKLRYNVEKLFGISAFTLKLQRYI
jgi:hypothetical protein